MVAAGVALVPLVLVVYYLLQKGLGAWSSTSSRPTRPAASSATRGGIKSAILGTIVIVALATAIAVPIGIGVALWLVEYGKTSWFAHARCATSST